MSTNGTTTTTTASSSSSPSQLSIAQSRVRSIMRTSPDALQVSQEALFAMTKATELFIEYTMRAVYDKTQQQNVIDYADLADYVQDTDELAILHEIIPRKVRASSVWHLITAANVAPAAATNLSTSSD